MRVQTVTFEKLADQNLAQLARSTSVFVVWDSADELRPKVLSHGAFLSLLDHLTGADSRLSPRLVAYISMIEGLPARRAAAVAAAIEELLQEVARDVNRAPLVVTRHSAKQRVRELCAGETLRINVRGFNPLTSPNRARRLSSPKRISVRPDERGYSIRHDWRARG